MVELREIVNSEISLIACMVILQTEKKSDKLPILRLEKVVNGGITNRRITLKRKLKQRFLNITTLIGSRRLKMLNLFNRSTSRYHSLPEGRH